MLGSFYYNASEFKVLQDRDNLDYLHYIGDAIYGSQIEIPYKIENCRRMFQGNHRLLTPPGIPPFVGSCWGMFRNCYNLKAGVSVPRGCTDCTEMFYGCGSIKYPPLITSGVRICDWMFAHCVGLQCEASYEQPCFVTSKISMYYACVQLGYER